MLVVGSFQLNEADYIFTIDEKTDLQQLIEEIVKLPNIKMKELW